MTVIHPENPDFSTGSKNNASDLEKDVLNQIKLTFQDSATTEQVDDSTSTPSDNRVKPVTFIFDQFKEVKEQYEKLHCKYGSALTNFSIGFIYRSKVSEFLTETDEETIYSNAKIHFEAALLDFIDLNHLTGEALCHKQLSHIQLKQNNKVSLNNS